MVNLQNRLVDPWVINWQQVLILGDLIHQHQIFSAEKVPANKVSLEMLLLELRIMLKWSIHRPAIYIVCRLSLSILFVDPIHYVILCGYLEQGLPLDPLLGLDGLH
jgi:hypothetical protein